MNYLNLQVNLLHVTTFPFELGIVTSTSFQLVLAGAFQNVYRLSGLPGKVIIIYSASRSISGHFRPFSTCMSMCFGRIICHKKWVSEIHFRTFLECQAKSWISFVIPCRTVQKINVEIAQLSSNNFRKHACKRCKSQIIEKKTLKRLILLVLNYLFVVFM